MSTPNPLAPQGSLLEKHGRGRSTFQIISFIGAIHVVALCGLLWIGCKKDDQSGLASGTGTGTGTGTGLDANPSGLPAVGGEVGLPPVGGNLPGYGAVPATNPPTPGYVGGPVTPTPPVVTSNPPTGLGLPVQPLGTVVPPPPPLDPPPAVTTAAGEYKVQKGDIGTTIAKKAGVSVAALKAANPSVDWTKLKLNQVLTIPAPTAGAAPSTGTVTGPGTGAAGVTVAPAVPEAGNSYVVRPGDTGSKIAKKTGVSWKSIRAASGLSSDSIRPGQKLTIPAKGAAIAPAPGAAPAGGMVAPTATPVPLVPTATPLPPLPGQ